MSETNPWNHIPLADYELHMEHQDVGQAKLLNTLTGKYLEKLNPEYVLFLGVSGGNGLEHINAEKVRKVCAIDVNDSYLKETRRRFGNKINHLELVNTDIGSSSTSYIKADFVWPALIAEYVNIDSLFEFININTELDSILVVTIQSNNGVQSVSTTGVESVKSVGSIFKIVDREALKIRAGIFGFECVGSEENFLPNGKSLVSFEFLKK
jgi:hypothetical protein